MRYAFYNRFYIRNYSQMPQSHHERKSNGGYFRGSSIFPVVAAGILFSGLWWYIGNKRSFQPVLLDNVLPKSDPDTSSTTPISRSIKPDHDVSLSNLAAARREIALIIGESNLIDRLDEIERHTGSEWSSHPANPQEATAVIVMPTSTEEVSKVMKICHRRRIPVVAFSGGTALE